jgi:hypothetical protein
MRLNYSDEEDRPGQFALWDANVRRSLKGKAGQLALRDLRDALLALPEKRLIANVLMDDEGGVCAVGAYAKAKGLDLERFDPEDESDEVGVVAGMPRLVAWSVVAQNDFVNDVVWEVAHGPLRRWDAHYKGGIPLVREMTPEERYERILAWVDAQLRGGDPVSRGAPHDGGTSQRSD